MAANNYPDPPAGTYYYCVQCRVECEWADALGSSSPADSSPHPVSDCCHAEMRAVFYLDQVPAQRADKQKLRRLVHGIAPRRGNNHGPPRRTTA